MSSQRCLSVEKWIVFFSLSESRLFVYPISLFEWHWPKTANVTTSLHDSEAAGPGRCFSSKPLDWQKSSIITYSDVRKVSQSTIRELLFLVNGIDKLTVGY